MSKRIVIDQMGRSVEIPERISLIVSTVPSQTELLVDLGLKSKLAGITKFCIHPTYLKKEVRVIGGTKNLKINDIIALKPDLVIGNKEENARADIEFLEQHVPVWMSDIHDIESALEMISMVGDITQTTDASEKLIEQIKYSFSELVGLDQQIENDVLYLIWRKPYLSAGTNTFINACLLRMNLKNVIIESRYPEIKPNAIAPKWIFLSSEPYPFNEKHITELQAIFPKSRIVLVDGEYFSWYGSRMLKAPKYFESLLVEMKGKD